MNIYQAEILDYYNNPKHFKKPETFTHSSRLENMSCGDEIEVYIELESNQIKAINYIGSGCVISLAAAEKLARVFTGKDIQEILQNDWEDVVKLLQIQLTASRIKCAHMPLEAMQQAIKKAK